MKFIHLTDTHVIGGGRLLYGANPAQRLRLAVDSINAEHGDADFTIVTGDLTHWGDAEAYATFGAEIDRLHMPVHLMIGNHDKTPDFAARFPTAQRDPYGFVQFAFDTPHGRAICLDTTLPDTHAGGMCAARLEWLSAELVANDAPVLLFMHHPPFPVGIAAMDAIRMQEGDALRAVLAPHRDRLRHLFFGHVHRAISGNWCGISFSCMRGLNHQVALDLNTSGTEINGDLVDPAYGVVLLNDDTVTVHMHEFANSSPRFSLHAPKGESQTAWALNMRHAEFDDYSRDEDVLRLEAGVNKT
jgi:3',5'-cyclic AMP phosphodiesterase CpdA